MELKIKNKKKRKIFQSNSPQQYWNGRRFLFTKPEDETKPYWLRLYEKYKFYDISYTIPIQFMESP